MEHGTHSSQVEQSILIPSVDDYLSDSQPVSLTFTAEYNIYEFYCCMHSQSLRQKK